MPNPRLFALPQVAPPPPLPLRDAAPPVRVLLLPDPARSGAWMARMAAEEDGVLLTRRAGGADGDLGGALAALWRDAPPARWLVVAEGAASLVLLKALRQPGPCPVAAALIVGLPDPLLAADPAVASRQPLPVPLSLVAPDAQSALWSARWALPWNARLLGLLPLPATAVPPTVSAWLAGTRRRLDHAAGPVTDRPASPPPPRVATPRFAIDC